MAKRKRQTAAQKPERKTLKKTATPKNPRPKEKSIINVNPSYDEMPDVVEDPASVFRMAMLDMRRVAANNKLAFVAKDQEQRVAAAIAEQKRVIDAVKAELREAEMLLVQQKQEIEKKYGIALRAYTYDDETGVLKKNDILVAELKEEAQKRAEEKQSA